MDKEDAPLNMPMKSSFQQELINAMNLMYCIMYCQIGTLKKSECMDFICIAVGCIFMLAN